MRNISVETEPLENLGLSATEIKVYLALLKLGSAKAGDLIRTSGVQNSVIHLTLGRLVTAGFISYVRRGKIKVYHANHPRQLLQLADERKARLEKLVTKLEALHGDTQAPEAEIYEGLTGLKNMCYKLIEDAVPGDDFLFFGFASSNEEYEKMVYKFYREYTDVRLQRGLVLRGIAHVDMRPRFVENDWPHRNIRFVNFPTLNNISICRNKVIIVPWEESQVSFLITSSSFAENCRNYFNAVWASLKKS